jgi:glycosyltransferase involved in cell wall biosynthesis
MIIGIDSREIDTGVFTGIGRALSAFLSYFRRLDDDNRIVLFARRPVADIDDKRISRAVVPERGTFVWDQIVLPRLVRQHGVDIFLSTYYKVPLLTPVPCIAWVFDVMYLTFPPYARELGPIRRLYYRTIGRLMLSRAAEIITCSEHSKREIAAWHRMPESRISAIPLGLQDAYRPVTDAGRIASVKQRHGISGDYLLYVGNCRPHKNVESVVAAFERAAATNDDLALVMIGNQNDASESLQTRLRGAARLHAIGTVTQEDQIALYSGARALLMPSWYEGFGYPALEAMACGAPVIASNAASVPEIMGDAGILVDPRDSDAIVNAISAVLGDPARAAAMREAGLRRAAKFGIDSYGRSLYEAIKRARRRG